MSLVWSSLEILSLSLFTPSNSIFDSQKKPNDSQDKFYFLSCAGCRGFVPVILPDLLFHTLVKRIS